MDEVNGFTAGLRHSFRALLKCTCKQGKRLVFSIRRQYLPIALTEGTTHCSLPLRYRVAPRLDPSFDTSPIHTTITSPRPSCRDPARSSLATTPTCNELPSLSPHLECERGLRQSAGLLSKFRPLSKLHNGQCMLFLLRRYITMRAIACGASLTCIRTIPR